MFFSTSFYVLLKSKLPLTITSMWRTRSYMFRFTYLVNCYVCFTNTIMAITIISIKTTWVSFGLFNLMENGSLIHIENEMYASKRTLTRFIYIYENSESNNIKIIFSIVEHKLLNCLRRGVKCNVSINFITIWSKRETYIKI